MGQRLSIGEHMADQAHEWTDEQIERLQRRFRRAYAQADREMREKLADFMASYDRENLEWQRKVKSGEAKQSDYDAWLGDMAIDREWMQGMVKVLSEDAVRTDQLANGYVNDEIPHVFAESANMAAYDIESSIHKDTHSFDLYDQDTVRRLIAEQPELLPPVPEPRFDNGRDLRWNRQKLSSAITQSVLQGESIPNAAKRVSNVMRMNERAAVRVARTALTGAENAGRVHSYQRAKDIGIDLEQQWIATFDNRTRHSHRLLHGQHVPVGEKFKVDGVELEFPGDPTAPGEYVWNCRCTLVAWFPDIEQEEKPLWTDWKDGTTYDEWKSGKKAEKDRKEAAGVVDGKSLLGTWKRRDGEFDFEVEDVINAQGFDGLPRVVNATDFDEAAAESNFVAIRGYRAPSQEVLDDYRRQLYEGKWYVDCSSGGAYHGQGMYTFSTDGTKPTDRMLDGVKSFSGVSGVEFGTVETMTVDPSFRSIEEDDIVKRFQQESLSSIRQRYGDDVWKMTRWSMGVDRPDDTYAEVSQRVYTQRPADVAAAMQEYVQASQLNGMDKGSAAALLGYDGIHVNVSPEVEYTVMLNRTKLIIREP